MIGSHHGIEKELSADPVIKEYHPVSTGKLRRQFSMKNLTDLFAFLKGMFQCRKLLKEIKPEFLLTTGGYVCLPAALAAYTLGIPVLAHEQTSVPGLSNRIVFRFASEILTTFDILASDKTSRVGNPPRRSARQFLADRSSSEVDGAVPYLFITGGANGSSILNSFVFDQINWLTDNFVVYHQFGMHEENRGTCEEKAKGLSCERYTGKAFFTQEQLLEIYSFSPVVLGRAGAGTINDIACFGLSSVLVPLESSAGGEQKSNADFLLSKGAALVVYQKEFDAKKAKQALLNAYVTREKTGMNISALLEYDIKTINKILDFYL